MQAWVKKMVRQRYAVTIVVFVKGAPFWEYCHSSAHRRCSRALELVVFAVCIPMLCVGRAGNSDDEYDHIVSVASIESDYDDDEYHGDDLIYIDDHSDPSLYRHVCNLHYVMCALACMSDECCECHKHASCVACMAVRGLQYAAGMHVYACRM